MKKHLRAVLVPAALLALTASTPATAAQPTHDAPTNPVLFVHGWGGTGARWDTMVDWFKADGWPDDYLHTWTYDFHQTNLNTAKEIAAEVDKLLAATGASQVDIVSHSMGGVSSRWYLKYLGGSPKVESWVSLGGPNHGTQNADKCSDVSCSEIRVDSDFLTALNSGDETPATPRYATWWSACDTVVNPRTSVLVAGAHNTQAGCLDHLGLLSDRTVYEQTRDWIEPWNQPAAADVN
ncbi:alpha/beta fold hydrolase [Streptomyces sp. NPDC096205]|uniref:esterase/lipase family protein n=1 Tax=Streptomyces sp. NPDC096205 TaxID=3366081 RepID=UPI0037F59EE8